MIREVPVYDRCGQPRRGSEPKTLGPDRSASAGVLAPTGKALRLDRDVKRDDRGT